MPELELIELSTNDIQLTLERLGYFIDEQGYVLNSNKKEVTCKYTQERVHIKTAAILPGSLLIINATPLSMAQYFLEYSNDE